VLTEVLQNAVEHGFGERRGRIRLAPQRAVGRLGVLVEDDGKGLPPGFDLDGSVSLGLSIVRTLVESELGGQLAIGPGTDRGTRVSLDVPLP
jgi:two-component sensor histidine kinase